MFRTLLVLTAFTLVAPAPAAAAPFGELPFRTTSGTATCLRATGMPGELVRSTTSAIEVLTAGAAGIAPTANFGVKAKDCPRAAARANGMGLIAYVKETEDTSTVETILREPGGRWAAAGTAIQGPQATDNNLLDVEGGNALAAAVSDRGDALVAHGTLAGTPKAATAAVLVARRVPGGAWGTAEQLYSARTSGFAAPTVASGLTATGEAIVAWAAQPQSAKQPRGLWVAIAPPGAPFGAPQKFDDLRIGAPFSLAVADDGRALLAYPSAKEMRVAERAPGGTFGASASVGAARDIYSVLPAVALRADGAAVVAWTELLRQRAVAVTRNGLGAFGTPVTLAAPKIKLPVTADDVTGLNAFLAGTGIEFGFGDDPDDNGLDPRATYLPDGRPLVTWGAIGERDGVYWAAGNVATLAPLAAQVLGAELRDATTATPFLLADGRAAAAWTDNADRGRGRIHVAVEGAGDPPDPPAPTVSVTGPSDHRLDAKGHLRLTVRCSAACDVRVQIPGNLDAVGTASLPAAGTTYITLDSTKPLAGLKTGPVKLLVRYGGPGTRQATGRTLTFQLRRRPTPKPVRVSHLSARRAGTHVVVEFDTDRQVDPNDLVALGYGADGQVVASALVGETPATHFRVTLKGSKVERVRIYQSGKVGSSVQIGSTRVRG